ncbi:MAG: hypothetical protein IJC09_05730 [Clostridia bacterium]|nr:hypothetical protein [Clostridia bacterium]
MNSIDVLRKIADKDNGIILTKTAVENGISRSNMSKLCKNGKIVRIANGQYVLPDDLNDELFSLQMRSKYIIYSHETALFLNGISERTPFEHTVTIPTSKTLSQSISRECKIYYIKDELHDLGRIQILTPMGSRVWAYDMDRTVCDIIRSRSRMADETFITAMKNYAKSPGKNLANLTLYAREMKILYQVRKYLEVLL